MNNNISPMGAAPFNMAIATLMRLDNILKEIKDLSYTPISNGVRQETKIELVKNFYINSVPLLKESDKEKFSWMIDIRADKKEVVKKTPSGLKKTGEVFCIFNQELENKMDKALVNIQWELQKGNFFMPPRRNAGQAVIDM